MDDPLEALATSCQGRDCASREQVAWCPAWDRWLCAGCRWQRSEREMRVPLADGEAMDRLARAAGS